MKNFNNFAQLINFQANKYNNPNALNYKKNNHWINFSNQDFLGNIFNFIVGLKEIGFGENEFLANCSYQNPTWLIVDFATIISGGVSVAIFNNISSENLFFQIEDSEAKFFFTDNLSIAEMVFDKYPEIKIIINDENFSKKSQKNEKFYDFQDLLILGENLIKKNNLKFSDYLNKTDEKKLATIIYTSGSTAKPKGVELSQANLISQIIDTEGFFPLKEGEVVLSFLPLAHVFERMVMMFYISCGVAVYFVDDVKNVGNLLKEISPNLMTTVPRLLEKVFNKIKENADQTSFVKKIIAKSAINRALKKDVSQKKNYLDKFFDLMVYSKFRLAMGGKMRMIICGGASLSNDMERFYTNIGINLFCGYGLTETSPVISANCQKNYKFGSVGKKYPSVEVKLAEDSELLARGKNIMLGYHKNIDKTNEVFISENGEKWFKTGDLASIDDEGFIKITGRKKELFKTANGKYVSPIFIEQKLIQNLNFLIGSIIIAEGKKFVSAILFADFDNLSNIKNKLSFKGNDEDFLTSEILYNYVKKIIDKINKILDHHQQIQKFYISCDQISVASGEITPSMKLKRNFLEKKYQQIIENFYQD
jgi:long-chain acyl-CoA synthetase